MFRTGSLGKNRFFNPQPDCPFLGYIAGNFITRWWLADIRRKNEQAEEEDRPKLAEEIQRILDWLLMVGTALSLSLLVWRTSCGDCTLFYFCYFMPIYKDISTKIRINDPNNFWMVKNLEDITSWTKWTKSMR